MLLLIGLFLVARVCRLGGAAALQSPQRVVHPAAAGTAQLVCVAGWYILVDCLVVQQHFNRPSVWCISPLVCADAALQPADGYHVCPCPIELTWKSCCTAAVCPACLQDVFALMPRYSQRPAKEETINDPTVTKHYWRYRCVTLCSLLNNYNM
jgi:hypothetical protein